MSDQRELDVLDLIDRAAVAAPAMSVAADRVVAGGRGKVRRRRATGVGMSLGGLALAGAVWLGLGGDGLLGATQQVSPASTTWEVPQDTTVTLRGEHDGELVMGDGRVRVGPVALHARADGTSAVDLTVDGRALTVQGEGVLGGLATAYRADGLTVFIHPLPSGDVRAARLGGTGESSGNLASVGGRSVQWWLTLPDASSTGVPDDVLLIWPDRVETLTGRDVLMERVAGGDVQVWEVPGLEWGLTSGGSTSSVPVDEAQLRVGADEETATWAVRVPDGARAARLVDGAGEPVGEASTDVVRLGGRTVAVGSAGWDASAGAAVQWQDGSGQWVDLAPGGASPGAWETGPFDDLTVSADPATGGLTVAREGQLLEPVPAPGDGLMGWRDTDGTLLVLAEGAMLVGDPVPVVRSGDGVLSARPDLLLQRGAVVVDDRAMPAVRLHDDDAALVAILVDDRAEGPQGFLGGAPQGTLGEGGDDGTVAWLDGSDVDLWAWVVPGDDRVLVAGTGGAVLARELDGRSAAAYALRALLPEGDGRLVADPSARLGASGGGMNADGTGPRVWTATVSVPTGADLSELVQGLDTDDDGAADVPLTQVIPLRDDRS